MFLLLNVLFLMCISFLPFPTSILARWITDPHQCKVAIFMYALGLFLPAFSWLLMWLYASLNHRRWTNALIRGASRTSRGGS